MERQVLDGKTLRDALISGANEIANNREMVDELNVFPVPDGDTGANMSATMRATLNELTIAPDTVTVGDISAKTASAALRGARGNSGVILSLLLRGLSKVLGNKSTATPIEFCEALESGVLAAYKSVMNPSEGTILTVSKEATAAATIAAKRGGDFIEVFKVLTDAAKVSLDNTPMLLPVLKKAGVVDAGGMGYLCIFRGMRSVIDGEGIIPIIDPNKKNSQNLITNAAGTFDGEITFTYCTEFLVRKNTDTVDVSALRAFLEAIGDSVVVVDDDDIIKVHVHTDNPGKALEQGLIFGSLTNMKIENMREQHEGEIIKAEQQKKNKLPPKTPSDKYGFVAVVSGAGLEELFRDLGVNTLVRGGQTFNPSTEDLLEAILATPAHNVFVLPNNKNIILAAEQAQRLVKDRNVVVLQTRTMPQGISALLGFNPEEEVMENSVQMTLSMDKVSTGTVTFAARDSDFDEKRISKNDILALENNKLLYVENDVTKALVKLTKRMVKNNSSYVTIIHGIDISESAAAETFKQLKTKINSDVEMVLVNGGQPIYYYIVSVE